MAKKVSQVAIKSTLKLKRPSRIRINLRSIKLWMVVMVIAGFGLFGASGYVWYSKIFSNEERVFYGMLSRSLETDSVTRTVSQDESSRKVDQSYFISFSPQTIIESSSTIEQIGQDRAKSSVTTRTIGDREVDYVQYSNINIPKSEGNSSDFTKVLNQWAKRTNNQETGEQAQFLNEAIFTFIPFGNFSQENRSELLSLIKQKKVYDIAGHSISYQDGRPVMELTISIKPKALIEVLREYASMSGIGDKDLLDPSQYERAGNVGVQIKVDMLSRHLTDIIFPGDSRKETYSAYGLNRTIEVPKNTISVEELQGRLQN